MNQLALALIRANVVPEPQPQTTTINGRPFKVISTREHYVFGEVVEGYFTDQPNPAICAYPKSMVTETPKAKRFKLIFQTPRK